MAKARINIELGEKTIDVLDYLVEREQTTRTEIVRRALSIVIAYDQQMKQGNTHFGFTSKPDKLDVEMLGILT